MQEALKNGVLAGYPIEDVRVELVFGSYHDVDSSKVSFEIAGSMSAKTACTASALPSGRLISEILSET